MESSKCAHKVAFTRSTSEKQLIVEVLKRMETGNDIRKGRDIVEDGKEWKSVAITDRESIKDAY